VTPQTVEFLLAACNGLRVLSIRTAAPDGGLFYNSMVVDRFGKFYGATVQGGEGDDGCVYKFMA
jgi:hypothetical protein